MKIIFTLIMTVFCSVVNAEIYKCTVNASISYQDEPCEITGGVGHVFKKKADISENQKIRAKAKLESELARISEREQLEKEAQEMERMIRAEEEKAFAAQQYAEQARRQAEALEERNYIESRRKSNLIYDRWEHNSTNHDHVKPEPPAHQQVEDNNSRGYDSQRMRMSPSDRMSP